MIFKSSSWRRRETLSRAGSFLTNDAAIPRANRLCAKPVEVTRSVFAMLGRAEMQYHVGWLQAINTLCDLPTEGRCTSSVNVCCPAVRKND